jgi:hypothetical protein
MGYDNEAVIAYLRRSYQAVDGLWFMKVEEADGFDRALALDERVWRVLAKIQARKARELLGTTGSASADLAACFGLKLTADGHEFEAEVGDDGVCITITRCPWEDLLRKSDRRHLACAVATVICPTEGKAWCEEFGGEFEFELPAMMCVDAEKCEMRFRRK